MEPWGYQNIPKEFLPAAATLTKLSKRAKKRYAKNEAYVIDSDLQKRFAPSWMKQEHMNLNKEPDDWDSMAQWTAYWWSRALSQLAIQGIHESEHILPGDLITSFILEVKMMLEVRGMGGLKYTAKYDAEVWNEMAEMVAKKDKRSNPAYRISHIADDIVARLEKDLIHDSVHKMNALVKKAPAVKAPPATIYCAVCRKDGSHTTAECYKGKAKTQDSNAGSRKTTGWKPYFGNRGRGAAGAGKGGSNGNKGQGDQGRGRGKGGKY
jgi:hypothetical protein